MREKRKEFGGYNLFSADRQESNSILNNKNVYCLNLGRNGLELILEARKPVCVHAPYYTCHSVHKVLESMVSHIEYYHIDDDLFPIIDDGSVEDDHMLLINNYFGVFEGAVKKAIKKYGNKVIVDNAQGFYSEFHTVDQILSPRKFFGLTDGGLLMTEVDISTLYDALEEDKSADRIKFLFKGDEVSKNSCYRDYLSYRESLQGLNPMKMSVATIEIFKTIDFEYCKEKRKRNYQLMNNILRESNCLKIPENNHISPMCYPFLSNKKSLKDKLISKNIYLGTYWPSIDGVDRLGVFEAMLRDNLCCLPVDQSMNEEDVEYVSKLVLDFL